MIGHFAEVAPDGRYINCISVALPALEMPAPTEAANVLVPVSSPLASFVGATPTEVPYLVDGVVHWVETAALDDIKACKRIEINAAYLLANKTSFSFAGKEIQANEHSMAQITVTTNGILRRGALRPDWSGYWKAMDDTYVAIPDVATWWQLCDAIEATGQANFDKAQALKAQIDAAQTAAAVAAIHWAQPTEAE